MPFLDIGYFKTNVPRQVKPRSLKTKLVAWQLDERYYDGDRAHGYGGFNYDGRWKEIIPRLIERYGLTSSSKVLEVGCKKGFFLHDLKQVLPGITVQGIENHSYPIETAMEDVRSQIKLGPYEDLPFEDKSFDFVMAFSSIYMLNLGNVVSALREIQRVTLGGSYVTLGAGNTHEELDLFRDWTLIGTTVLLVDEWQQLIEEVGYRGDYYFTTAKSLNLKNF